MCRALKSCIFIVAFTIVLQNATGADQDEGELFLSVTNPAGREMPSHAAEHTARAVGVAHHLLTQNEFRLNLFAGRTFSARLDRFIDYKNGDFVWVGRITGEPLSRVTFAVRKGVVAGVIERVVDAGNELYELSPGADGGYVLFQSDEKNLPPFCKDAEHVHPAGEAPDASVAPDTTALAEAQTETAADAVVADIMVVYTPATLNRYGQAGTEAKILQAVADANTAYENSQIGVQLNLVYMGIVNYVETGDIDAALSYLRGNGDGVMDEVHTQRNQYGADLVCLIDEDSNYCGVGYVMQTVSTSFAPYAFSVVRSGCIGNLSFTHEVGHNFGNAHNRESASSAGPYPYSYGWRHCATDGTAFRCIMSYNCSGAPRINYFSNPNLSYNGYPLGISYESDPASAADCARSMNNTVATVAAFRAAPTPPPSAPTNLSATALACDRVNITWVDNAADESSYHVERSLDGSSWTGIATLGPNTSSYLNSSLSANTTYHYRVRASNAAGYSVYSNLDSATTPLPPPLPAAPSGLLATAVSGTQINLNWVDESADEDGFKIERSQDGLNWSQVATVASNVIAFADPGLAPNTGYTYRLCAYNGSGNSAYSNLASVTTPQTAPSTPINLQATAASSSQIDLTWTDISGNESGFAIERSLTGTSGWSEIARVTSNTTSYSNTALAASTTYFYRVCAYNSIGASGYSNIGSARTKNGNGKIQGRR